MLIKSKYILVGAKNPVAALQKETFGGVLTLSNAIVDYADEADFDIAVIDTLQKPFIKKSIFQDIRNGFLRTFQLSNYLAFTRCAGVIIFSSAGFGFYEKIIHSIVCRIFSVPSVLFIVDGRFFSTHNRSFVKKWMISMLLNIPNTLVASGMNCFQIFQNLGVKESRLVIIHYWLSKSFPVATHPVTLTDGASVKFIFIGWMIKEKGINEILAALDYLYEKYQFSFTFIGGGPMQQDVCHIINKSNWNSRVSALGWVSTEQKQIELSASHVFVLPSYSEGFPMAVIEAMSTGLPVICSDVGGVSDSVHNGINGFLIQPNNIQQLIDAMEYYISNPEILSRHSLESLTLVRKNHNANENCEKLFNIFTRN